MGHLSGLSGIGKAQFLQLVEVILRPFRLHDKTGFRKLMDWQRLSLVVSIVVKTIKF